jgi:hypothetical protein
MGNHIRAEGAPKQKEEAGFSSINTNGHICLANRLAPVLFNMTERRCDETQQRGRISQLAIDRKWPATDRLDSSTEGHGIAELDILCEIYQSYWWTVWKQSRGAVFDNTPTLYVAPRLEDWLSLQTWFVVFLSP